MARVKSPDKSKDHPAGEKLAQVVHRHRQRSFCIDAADKVLQGMPVQTAITEAVQENFMQPYGNGPYTEEGALHRANELIRKPEIQQGLTILFEAAGLTQIAAAKKHVEHINGVTFTGERWNPQTKAYEETSIQLPPNYQALADYWKLTTPKPATKVEVRSASVMEVIDRPSDAPMAARSLKTVTIEQEET